MRPRLLPTRLAPSAGRGISEGCENNIRPDVLLAAAPQPDSPRYRKRKNRAAGAQKTVEQGIGLAVQLLLRRDARSPRAHMMLYWVR